jgi:Ca2+-binding EF-hand superfamily protein
MTKNTKIALLLGAALAIGLGPALAHMDAPRPPDGPMQGMMHRDRMADRLLEEFDTKKDGKITRAEFNNVLGTRFAAATHGAKFMAKDQFATIHEGEFKQHASEMFRRIDWNSDGKLNLEEFEAPQRAHFQMMDSDGSGVVSCNPDERADLRPGTPPSGDNVHGDWRDHRGGWMHRGFGGPSGAGGFDRAMFCYDADVSRDGRVTRAELDAIMSKHFNTATGGAPFMTVAQFIGDLEVHYRRMNDKMFERLDKDGDGKLSMAEFSAPELRLFDRLDRNHDGVITADEMKPHFRDGDDWGHGDWHHGHGDRDDDRGPDRDN